MNAIFSRISVREFLPKPVEPEKLERLLRAAMAAPSAGNQQGWAFYVVKNPAVIAQLAECSPYAGCAKNAPVCIVPCTRKSGARHGEYLEIDCSAATENLLLEAVELGLGAVWLGIAPLKERMDAARRVLDLPEDLEAFAFIPVGYPASAHPQQDRYDAGRVHIIE